mgnify:FL=1
MAKYITFEDSKEKFDGKPIYNCFSKRDRFCLAEVFWYKPWKQWTCRFNPNSVWSEDCLEDVRKFILLLGA